MFFTKIRDNMIRILALQAVHVKEFHIIKSFWKIAVQGAIDSA